MSLLLGMFCAPGAAVVARALGIAGGKAASSEEVLTSKQCENERRCKQHPQKSWAHTSLIGGQHRLGGTVPAEVPTCACESGWVFTAQVGWGKPWRRQSLSLLHFPVWGEVLSVCSFSGCFLMPALTPLLLQGPHVKSAASWSEHLSGQTLCLILAGCSTSLLNSVYNCFVFIVVFSLSLCDTLADF